MVVTVASTDFRGQNPLSMVSTKKPWKEDHVALMCCFVNPLTLTPPGCSCLLSFTFMVRRVKVRHDWHLHWGVNRYCMYEAVDLNHSECNNNTDLYLIVTVKPEGREVLWSWRRSYWPCVLVAMFPWWFFLRKKVRRILLLGKLHDLC